MTSTAAPIASPWTGARGWMSTGQAAKRLGYHRQTLWRWCEEGRIEGARRAPSSKAREGDWRIPIEWVRSQIVGVVRRKPSE